MDAKINASGVARMGVRAAAQCARTHAYEAELARELLATSRGRLGCRRLFTQRTGLAESAIVGGDPQRRRFGGWLAHLIGLRDRTCRDPFCDAPIRHADHIVRSRDGGATTLTNGRGVCERGKLGAGDARMAS